MRPYLFLLLIAVSFSSAQQWPEPDPCGFADTTSLEYLLAASGNWGYGYDTLLYDIAQWRKSPFVTVDSVGLTVQLRTMYTVTIQDTAPDPLHARKRVWVHARTHPNEVQGTWVTNEMIKALLADDTLGRTLRQRYVFNIMPMYNIDGVELGGTYDRENANGVDIESNWNAANPQPEVLVLRAQFQKYMAMPNPMAVMLNMHSAYACRRYFVFHAAAGTSPLFAAMQERFIGYVRSFFPGAIEPSTYMVSWKTGPALQYPESWCWLNHQEKIMALTYEDGNCAAAGKFDSTALAILKGVDAYLQDTTAITGIFADASGMDPRDFSLGQNYPNPFNPSTVIPYTMEKEGPVTLTVYDLLGRESAVLVRGNVAAGRHTARFDAAGLPSGLYVARLSAAGRSEAVKMMLMK